MRKLTYHIAISVDAFIAPPSETFEAFVQEGDHAADYVASWAAYDTVIMGRRTYEYGSRLGVTNPYPAMRTYVCSATMVERPDPAVEVIAGDPVPAVRALKEADGRTIYLCGGGRLAAALFRAGLIDEVILKINPVVLGDGVRLFGDVVPQAALALRDARIYPNGVAVLAYRVTPPS